MKDIEIKVLKENMLQLQICCNLAPEEMRKRKEEAEGLLPSLSFGLRWRVELDQETFLGEPITPVPCSEKEGYWHYICFN